MNLVLDKESLTDLVCKHCEFYKESDKGLENEEFIQYCLSENLIALSETLVKRDGILEPSPIPSLRYLKFQMTDRCNLGCRHDYIENSLHQDLPFKKILKILREFEEIRGLRLLLSGREPLLHPHFGEINEVVRDHALSNFPPSPFSRPFQEPLFKRAWRRKGESLTVTGPIMT